MKMSLTSHYSETLRLTTLGSKQAGDAVNIEIDSTTMMIVETVERLLKEN